MRTEGRQGEESRKENEGQGKEGGRERESCKEGREMRSKERLGK